jgi:hypothetical protein
MLALTAVAAAASPRPAMGTGRSAGEHTPAEA